MKPKSCYLQFVLLPLNKINTNTYFVSFCQMCVPLNTINMYICHAPNVKCVQQWPHAHFGDAPTTMHMGTNQKAQQSCGSGTDRE